VIGRIYVALAALFWPVATLISTAYAIKLKLPPLRAPRPRQIVDLVN
jgi:hypothetical protein